MRTLQRLSVTASLFLFAAQPFAPALAQNAMQIQTVKPTRIYPLPGSIDSAPLLNSNSPEVVDAPGILVSTLPAPAGNSSPFLDYAFNGDFGVFSHHIFKDEVPGARLLYLGLLASNFSSKPVKITVKQGASYLSQPDAPFSEMSAFARNPAAAIYAGPGDRVATELISGKMQYKDLEVEIPAYSTGLVNSLPINTDVPILTPTKDGKMIGINGRSTLMHMHSDGPVYLSQVAYVADRKGDGFTAPTLEDYQMLLNQRQFSGKHEPATLYDPATPPAGSSFTYGRVAGVSQGITWQGTLWEGTRILERPAVGETVGYPIASTYLKRFATGQNQSAPMLRRYADTAQEAHANYGLVYNLNIPLHNTTAQFQTYSLGLSQPLNPQAGGKLADMIYMLPPNAQTMFRGTVRLQWDDEFHRHQDLLTHLVLKNGQESAALDLITVPPHVNYDIKLSLLYPADATPPQLLTISRVE